jgi:hypothetical protein
VRCRGGVRGRGVGREDRFAFVEFDLEGGRGLVSCGGG